MLLFHVPENVVCHSAEITVLFASDVLAFFVVDMVTLVCVEVVETLIGVINLFSCGPEPAQGIIDFASSTEYKAPVSTTVRLMSYVTTLYI
jgi:hypothetical protein